MLASLIALNKTVFSLSDLGKIWGIADSQYLRLAVFRLVSRGELFRICRGYYSLRKDYESLELAFKLLSPSYVSLETVLFRKGVIFQDYSMTISSAGINRWEKKIDGMLFSYFKIKNDVLLNPMGVEHKLSYAIAGLERAIGDMVYLHPNYYFDNLTSVDKKKLIKITDIYQNGRVYRELKKLC